MAEPQLVSIEIRFITQGDEKELGDRIREAVGMIVGRDELEDFRLRSMPLTPKKRRGDSPLDAV